MNGRMPVKNRGLRVDAFACVTARIRVLILGTLCVSLLAARGEEPAFERGAVLIRNETRIGLRTPALRALALAAHPDDEDGATLSYLRQHGIETHICFATRGEGGQNETGPELGVDLAVLRTKEIAEACAILGAKPWFLNLPDFGFSKSVEETMQVWNHDVALERLVRIIRTVKPQLVITNHDPDGTDHGHHRTAAKLLVEAFDAAADTKRFPAQITSEHLQPWKISRILLRRFAPPGASLTVDVSMPDPLSGLSASEIGALALARHSTQGMLRNLKAGERELRYFSELKSSLDQPADRRLWDGLGSELPQADPLFTTSASAALIDLLVARLAQDERNSHLQRALVEALGLRLEATADEAVVAPGDPVKIALRAANTGERRVRLNRWRLEFDSPRWSLQTPPETGLQIEPHGSQTVQAVVTAEAGAPYSFPERDCIFARSEIRKPVAAVAEFILDLPHGTLVFDSRIEVPLDLAPPLTFSIPGDPLLIFSDPAETTDEVADFTLLATCHKKVTEPLFVAAAAGPLPREGESGIVQPFHATGETIAWRLHQILSSDALQKGAVTIETHVWDKVYYPAPTLTARRVPFTLPAQMRVALIKGVDDQTAHALKRLQNARVALNTFAFDTPSDDELLTLDWKRYHAVIIDIRVTQQRPIVRRLKDQLQAFMQDGGTVVCMYQKDFDWNDPAKNQPVRGGGFFKGINGAGALAPYPIELSFERVTREDAPVRMLQETHPLLLKPCRIWQKDFDGWVQERGAYFPTKWAADYTALLSSNDPGEKPLDGGLLVADVGPGAFIYTSYFWHRQLQAGVPGAYRMLANLLCYSRMKREK